MIDGLCDICEAEWVSEGNPCFEANSDIVDQSFNASKDTFVLKLVLKLRLCFLFITV